VSIDHQNLCPPLSNSCPPVLNNLIKKCWSVNPGSVVGVQLHCVGAGEVRPLREGGDAGDGAPGAQALALLRQDLQDGLHHQQLVHTGACVIHLHPSVAELLLLFVSVLLNQS